MLSYGKMDPEGRHEGNLRVLSLLAGHVPRCGKTSGLGLCYSLAPLRHVVSCQLAD
jgi:hypothetical protein